RPRAARDGARRDPPARGLPALGARSPRAGRPRGGARAASRSRHHLARGARPPADGRRLRGRRAHRPVVELHRRGSEALTVSQDAWAAVDRYITDLLVPTDPALTAALERSAAAGLPPWAVSPSQGKLLDILARAVGARIVLEIGTLGGYSTIWLA